MLILRWVWLTWTSSVILLCNSACPYGAHEGCRNPKGLWKGLVLSSHGFSSRRMRPISDNLQEHSISSSWAVWRSESSSCLLHWWKLQVSGIAWSEIVYVGGCQRLCWEYWARRSDDINCAWEGSTVSTFAVCWYGSDTWCTDDFKGRTFSNHCWVWDISAFKCLGCKNFRDSQS